MCTQSRRQLRSIAALLLPAVLSTCRSGEQHSTPPDGRRILEAHISHGIGDSPFDSPLVRDSLAAQMIVQAGECASIASLHDTRSDTGQATALIDSLRRDGIVDNRGDLLCTTFPILMGHTRDRYAELTDDIAERAYNEFAVEWDDLLQVIRDRGWGEWQYHFVWSQIFDSQVAWAEMMNRGLVPPLSQLIAWVVFPEHPFRSGTNYYPDTELRDYWLMVTWRAGAANTTERVAAHWDVLYDAGVTTSQLTVEERAQLDSLGVLDSAGELAVPVLRPHDTLYQTLQALARRYVDHLEQKMPLVELVQLSGVDEQRAFAMAYHDASWGVIERLAGSGQIEVPPALQPGDRADRSHLRGVFALTPAYPPFVDLIRSAIGAD